jgi:LPXTG-motif cell wall-anchored protein
MYGKLPTLGGVAALPATGSSRPLFIAAVSLIAAGVVIMIAAAVMARKSRKSEATA